MGFRPLAGLATNLSFLDYSSVVLFFIFLEVLSSVQVPSSVSISYSAVSAGAVISGRAIVLGAFSGRVAVLEGVFLGAVVVFLGAVFDAASVVFKSVEGFFIVVSRLYSTNCFFSMAFSSSSLFKLLLIFSMFMLREES